MRFAKFLVSYLHGHASLQRGPQHDRVPYDRILVRSDGPGRYDAHPAVRSCCCRDLLRIRLPACGFQRRYRDDVLGIRCFGSHGLFLSHNSSHQSF